MTVDNGRHYGEGKREKRRKRRERKRKKERRREIVCVVVGCLEVWVGGGRKEKEKEIG